MGKYSDKNVVITVAAAAWGSRWRSCWRKTEPAW